MSNLVYPSLPGLSWNRQRDPVWASEHEVSASGVEYSFTSWTYPRWRYRLQYEVLRAGGGYDEMQQLVGFFNRHHGSAQSWLFDDVDDNTATAQQFGVGDGVQADWQLLRALGGFVEPVIEPKPGFQVFLDGVLTTAYTLGAKGVLTFSAPPADGVVLTWTGGFWWRCRFLADQLSFNQFLQQLYELRQVEFITRK